MLVKEFPREWNAEKQGEGWLLVAEDGFKRYLSEDEFYSLFYPIFENKCGNCGHNGEKFECEEVDGEYMYYACRKCGSCTSVDVHDDSFVVKIDCVDVDDGNV